MPEDAAVTDHADDPRLEFSLDEFDRLLKWAYEGLLAALAEAEKTMRCFIV